MGHPFATLISILPGQHKYGKDRIDPPTALKCMLPCGSRIFLFFWALSSLPFFSAPHDGRGGHPSFILFFSASHLGLWDTYLKALQ
jgi:hypothetical protein